MRLARLRPGCRLPVMIAGLWIALALGACSDDRPPERIATGESPPGNDVAAGASDRGQERRARAELEPTQDNEASGTVHFRLRDAAMHVDATVRNLEPGLHGLHIHAIGDCSAPDASSAGGHFNPRKDPHGAPVEGPGQHHAGDLGNIVATAGRPATLELTDRELRFDGEFGILGRSVIVHGSMDDLQSQPGGDAGPRLACGVIREIDAD